jgi:hypothetical protein
MVKPTKSQNADIKRRSEAAYRSTLPPTSKLKLARQNILYCGSREYTLLLKSEYKAKVHYYKIMAELYKKKMNAWRAKLSPDSTRTITGRERTELENAIRVNQPEANKYRDWLRHNKEFKNE